jgi:hypothetical protein
MSTEAGCSPSSSAEVKNAWSRTSTPLGFMVRTAKDLYCTYTSRLRVVWGGGMTTLGRGAVTWECSVLRMGTSVTHCVAFCCREVSFFCSAVIRIVTFHGQIFDLVGKSENRNPYTVTTRVKVLFAVTGGFMLINVTKIWESLAGW